MIETERLRLRPWQPQDKSAIAQHLNSPAVLRWLGPVLTPEKIDALYERMMLIQAKHGFCFWALDRKEEGAYLGFCGLKIADARNCPVAGDVEIGWRLREDAWGHGYAKEAAQAALAFAFERLSAPRVIALTVDGNEASWGLMRRLGMTERREYAFDDPSYDAALNPTVVYVIEAATWRGLRGR